jgi:hypothetical protein
VRSDDPTPPARSVATVDRWPLYESLARAIATACHLEAERRVEEAFTAGTWRDGVAYAEVTALRRIASDGRAIAAAFAAWAHRDPGGTLRRDAIMKLLDLRAEAGGFGVSTPV